jgi:beta-lactamase regulating signal transducer with metallopeptidase domain/ankyrin repeat protein
MNELLKLMLVLVGNHLWQSTLFALAIWGVTLLLRRNSARLRYWLWLAASLKFLVPFALLAALGTQIPWHPALPEPGTTTPVIVDMAGSFSAPMGFEFPFPQSPAAGPAPAPEGTSPLILVFVAWALGATFVSLRWLLRWLEIRRAVRNSAVMTHIDFPAPVRTTTTQLEPGIVGIFRPSLLLPAGIDERLTPAQMRAVLAHERCHLRCRDNLTASLHMRVEVLFWFHPLVWWIGARLIEERERACDEEVIRDGHSAESYAEGILAVCEHYIASRLRSVSGVSGSDLRRRIEGISRKTLAVRLDGPRKLLLAAVMGCLVAAPIGAGMIAGSTWQVLFSLEPYTASMVEYSRLTVANLNIQGRAATGNTAASLCPAPTSPALAQQRRTLASMVAKLSANDGDRVLLYAVAAGSTADVKRLLVAGASRKGDGFLQSASLMHIAALLSDAPVLQVLSDYGVSVDGWSGPFGRQGNGLSAETPLMVAIAAGRRDNVEWLLQHGADVDATNQAGASALVSAMAICHDQALTTKLLQAGARPNRKARQIATTLGFDLGASSAPASPQYQRATALWGAVVGTYTTNRRCGRFNADFQRKQQRLAAAVAGLSVRDGEDALLYAVMAGSTADVKRLLAEGAPTTGFFDYPPLHTAAQFGEPPMLEALVQAGLAVKSPDGHGTTTLHAAAIENRRENVAWLIRHGADVNALNDQGVSVLAYALPCIDQDLIDTLLRAGARPDMRTMMVAADTGVALPTYTLRGPTGELVRGWRAPTQAELDKLPARKDSPTRYVQATADLDGDGKQDQAALLIASDESKEALFVKLSSRNPDAWTFAAQKVRRPQGGIALSGISIHEPGRIPRMCDKGYGRPCDPAEPKLVLQHQGIDYFDFEGAASVVYYDNVNQQFRQAWYTD